MASIEQATVGATSLGSEPVRALGPGGFAAVVRRIPRYWLWQVIALLSIAIVWQIAGLAANFIYLPPLSDVLVALWELIVDGTIWNQLGVSLSMLAAGLSISIVGGVLIGVLMGLFRPVRYALDVYVDAMMAAPMVAFVPLFIMLFGLGAETRLAVVILFALFPIIVNTQVGVEAADRRLIEMGKSFGVSRLRAVFALRLPMAYPQIRAGLRLGVSRGVDGLITGEVLISVVGLGGLVSKYGNGFTMDRLFAVAIVIVVLALVAVQLTDFVTRIVFGVRRR
ncbi:ABC transporter permease [Compostimonas suwonensis]|uniref:NitT/TauT family transport system permease protein n=1 Tax=Compostimonas suwonensis TaxID=1048394 RepID=A0A2M9BZU9_9MICO|nr:ABC transporter permease subunit [Compostimonas suwonensis]PJJ63608.1 NitT/TauT family transport system permease protein [Compostimonas suwonensis]